LGQGGLERIAETPISLMGNFSWAGKKISSLSRDWMARESSQCIHLPMSCFICCARLNVAHSLQGSSKMIQSSVLTSGLMHLLAARVEQAFLDVLGQVIGMNGALLASKVAMVDGISGVAVT